MSFWSVQGAEPKRNYRWTVIFAGEGAAQNISFALKKVDKPKFKTGEATHKYLNHTFNYPGRVEWEPINMAFASTTDPDATAILNDIMLRAGYGVPSGPATEGPQLATLGKNKFNRALGNTITLQQVNADGDVIEAWQVHNPFFTNIAYGSLDYSNEEIVEITCTVRYDWAQLTRGNGPSDMPGNPVAPGFP